MSQDLQTSTSADPTSPSRILRADFLDVEFRRCCCDSLLRTLQAQTRFDQRRTRSARSVFHLLGQPSPSSSAK